VLTADCVNPKVVYSDEYYKEHVKAGHKPGSVFQSRAKRSRNDDHSSRPGVAARLERPTRELERTTLSVPLFGLAPDGVCLAPTVTGGTGKLLPHRFTLTLPCGRAVYFLLHFPPRHRDWALSSILSCGARTFLPRALRHGSGHLSCFNMQWNVNSSINICKGMITIHPGLSPQGREREMMHTLSNMFHFIPRK
jgi:hypothetical protein